MRDALKREEDARIRDVRALARDRAADARDRAAEDRERAALRSLSTEPDALIASVIAGAAADRARAAEDRRLAAADRAQAARDRDQAQVDLRHAHIDGLTGVYSRELGLEILHNEVDRALRSGAALVLAFVDVDGLKQVNDRDGHTAGDALLRHVATTMRSKLRSYEPIVRMGGDEFLCAFVNTEMWAAHARCDRIHRALLEGPGGSISVGLAGLGPDDTLEDLIERSDAALYRAREREAG